MKTKKLLKRIFRVLLVAVFGIVISSYSIPLDLHAEDFVNNDVAYAVDELNINSLWNWQVTFNEYTGLPESLYGALSNRYDVEPEEAAGNFLADNAELFGLEDPLYDFVMLETIQNKGTYILYVQTYENIPFENSFLLVSVTRDNRVSLAKSRLFHNVDLDTNPQLSEIEAYTIALEDAKNTVYVEEPGDTELVIIHVQETFQLAWKVQFKTDEYGGTIMYIINEKGAIIEKREKNGYLPHCETPYNIPLLAQEDVIKALNSITNIDLLNESKELIKIIYKLEQENYKNIVAEAIITADLNVTGGHNIPKIIADLNHSGFLTQGEYDQVKNTILESLALVNQLEPLVDDISIMETSTTEDPTEQIELNADTSHYQTVSNGNGSGDQPIFSEKSKDNLLQERDVEIGIDNTQINEDLPQYEPPVDIKPAPIVEREEPISIENTQMKEGEFLTEAVPGEENHPLQLVKEEEFMPGLVPAVSEQEDHSLQLVQEQDQIKPQQPESGIISPTDSESPALGEETGSSLEGPADEEIDMDETLDLADQLGESLSNQFGEMVNPNPDGPQIVLPDIEGQGTISQEEYQSYYLTIRPQAAGPNETLHEACEELSWAREWRSYTQSAIAETQSLLNEAQAQGNDTQIRELQSVLDTQNEELNAAQFACSDLSIHVDALSQASETSNNTTANDDTNTTGNISDFLDTAPPSSSEGAAATGSITGYNTDSSQGSGATGGISGYNYSPGSNLIAQSETNDTSGGSDGSGATGGISGYNYSPESNLIAQSETNDTSGGSDGSGATGSTSGYNYTPGSNLIAQSETNDSSGGSSNNGGTSPTGSISG